MSRHDPFAYTPQHRRLMLSFFYPTTPFSPSIHSFAPYLACSRLSSDFDEIDHFPSGTTARYQPQAYLHAPVDNSGPALPILLFSTGLGVMRQHYTITLQNLASEGYFCVSIGHTYDTAIYFPSTGGNGEGELVWQIGSIGEDPELSTRVRAEDAIFALSQLADNANFRSKIQGLGKETLDFARVGMFGHSMGGAAALEAMRMDDRIKGGVNIDGAFRESQISDTETDRPFLVISAPREEEDRDGSLGKMWSHLKGWRAALEIEGALHMSFLDCAACYQMLGVLDIVDPKRKTWGTIEPLRIMIVQTVLLKRFFDFALKGGDDDIFRKQDEAFPEIKFCF